MADVRGRTFTINPAVLFSDIDEANEAAREDGAIGPGQDPPNPFYIRSIAEEALSLSADPRGRYVVLAFDAFGAPTEAV